MTTTATGVDAPPADHSGETSHALGLTGWLHLAAAPTFTVMALLNALAVTPMDVLCSGHGMPALGGMTLMYALMAVFHAGPWLRRVAPRRGRRDRRRRNPVPAILDSKSVRVERGGT